MRAALLRRPPRDPRRSHRSRSVSTVGAVVPAALGFLLVLGLAERLERDRCARSLRIRVQVNGTRGKSTTTRLVRAALAAGGVAAAAKTTGTAPRFIMPDGRELPLRRRAAASIREQLAAMRMARRAGAEALVAECMALRPELQWASEHLILRSTVGVITNVRADHRDVMGRSLVQIADSLANTIPRGGTLVTGDERFAARFERRARELGAEFVLAPPLPAGAAEGFPEWWAQDAAIALAAAGACGVDGTRAIEGMRAAAPDPGAARLVGIGGGLEVLDLSAANDPESLLSLLADLSSRGSPLLLVYNHRADRPTRLADFLAAALPGELVLTGDFPGRRLARALSGGGRAPAYVGPGALESYIASWTAAASLACTGPCETVSASNRGTEPFEAGARSGERMSLVVLCGNTKGWKIAGAGCGCPASIGLGNAAPMDAKEPR